MKKLIFFLGVILCASPSISQNCQLTNAVTINTGRNPASGGLIPVNQQDPNWIISNVSPFFQGVTGINPGTPSTVIQAQGVYLTLGNSRWISHNVAGGHTHPNNDNNIYSATFTRTFRLCSPGTVNFNFSLYCDNILVAINLAGTAVNVPPNSGGWGNGSGNVFVVNQTLNLPAGVHNIDIVVQNQTNVTGHTINPNPFGLNVAGTVNSTNNILVTENGTQQSCICPTNCSDTCYWKVTGNNIINGNNILGTLTNDAIRIFSNNTFRGSVAANGGFGWQTIAPSTMFHVNALNNGVYPQAPSGMRFENIPRGFGEMLVVDVNGYVFRQRNIQFDPPLSNNCGQLDYLTKTGNGVLECSQVYDDGSFVGIGSTVAPIVNGTPALFYVNGLAAVNSLWSVSDGKYKQDIKPITNALAIINQLRGVTYNWNSTGFPEKHFDKTIQAGFIAQEVKNVFPAAVSADNQENHLMNYNAFIPLLTRGQQELVVQVEELKKEIAMLKNLLNERPSTGITAAGERHSLSQNRPNPFNGTTIIDSYIADVRSSAFIMIYDMTGKELLKFQLKGKGKQSITVDRNQLKNGMYLYSLIIDDQEIETKKMIVMD